MSDVLALGLAPSTAPLSCIILSFITVFDVDSVTTSPLTVNLPSTVKWFSTTTFVPSSLFVPAVSVSNLPIRTVELAMFAIVNVELFESLLSSISLVEILFIAPILVTWSPVILPLAVIFPVNETLEAKVPPLAADTKSVGSADDVIKLLSLSAILFLIAAEVIMWLSSSVNSLVLSIPVIVLLSKANPSLFMLSFPKSVISLS